jgi:hypothetical protein
MFILWTNHPYDKNLNGTKEHVARSVAESAFQFKQAVLAEKPRYGTPEWLAERAAMSAAVATPPTPATVTFEVGKGPIDGQLSLVAKCSRGCTARFTGDVHTAETGDLKLLHSCGDQSGPVPFSAAAIAEYRKLKDKENPNAPHSAQDAEYYAAAAPQESKPSKYPPMPLAVLNEMKQSIGK